MPLAIRRLPSILRLAALASLWVALAGQLSDPLAATAQTTDCTLAVETGRYLCEPFHTFWDANDGLETFGLPITGAFETSAQDSTQSVHVQYFERQRFELHSGSDGETLALGRLGVEVLTARGRAWQAFPRADPARDGYFTETGHAIDPLFQAYWSSHGLDLGDADVSSRESLALFGYPISELMIETNSSLDQVVVQWYERARLEYHPQNPPGSRVQLGRLGAELNPREPVPAVGLEVVAEGLTSPIALAPAPDTSRRLFIVDQIGLVRILEPDGTLRETPFLDVRDRMVPISGGYDERGLLGFAFHPAFDQNGRIYVNYSAPLRPGAPTDWNHTARISEFQVSSADPLSVDLATERILLQVDEPHWAHNGGVIAFGPDGYLYIGFGDGGHGGDVGLGHVDDWYAPNQGGNGQDIDSNLLGSILRIDVDGAGEAPYAIPPDNPFVGKPGLDEIWAYGLRNPFRFSFDLAGTGALFVGDVGQDRWEEINIVTGGNNYGWNVREGSGCFYNVQPAPSGPCPAVDPLGNALIPPIIEFSNTGAQEGGPGRAVIGGYVYRGNENLALYGQFIFGTWSQDWNEPSGRLLVGRPPPGGAGQWSYQLLDISGAPSGLLSHYVLGFGQDNAGELYVLTSDRLSPNGTTGKVHRLTH